MLPFQHNTRVTPEEERGEREKELQNMAAKTKVNQLSLEVYLDFLHSQKRSDLTVNSLNQIIQMHGFRKIHHGPKRVLLDAVEAIELMDASRSTLDENISSHDVQPSLEEAIADIDELSWHECVITSVENVGKENRPPANSGSTRTERQKKAGGGASHCKRTASSGSETSGGARGNARKRKALKEANAGESTSGGDGDCSCSNQLEIGIRR